MPGRDRTSVTGGARRTDPRLYQIAILTALLGYGVLGLRFEVDLWVAASILGGSLATQAVACRALGLGFDWRSPLISALSLCLLLRTPELRLALVASVVAIGSKFLIRHRGKHLFNPSALALVVLVLVSDRAWVSPGQWGSVAFFGLLVAGLGTIVVVRAERSDVTFAFLLSWAAVVFGRALWLGDPLAIPTHQIQSGALLLFAFFMISDPKTSPDSRSGRILFAALVALGAGLVQFGLYRANGPLYALVACSVLVPWIDRWLPATGSPRRPPKGASHATPSVSSAGPAALPGLVARSG